MKSDPKVGEVIRCGRCGLCYEVILVPACANGCHPAHKHIAPLELAGVADRAEMFCVACVTPDEMFGLALREQAAAAGVAGN